MTTQTMFQEEQSHQNGNAALWGAALTALLYCVGVAAMVQDYAKVVIPHNVPMTIVTK